MERHTFDEATVTRLRSEVAQVYPANSKPGPGSFLKHDDHVSWFSMVPMCVLWGHPNDDTVHCYCPDWFGDTAIGVLVQQFEDRAPADPEETPMPLYPVQQQQQQQQPQRKSAKPAKGTKPDLKEVRKAIKTILKQLTPEEARASRKRIKALHADLVDDG